MVKAHPFLYIPTANLVIQADGTATASGRFEKYAAAQYKAIAYVLKELGTGVLYQNPNMSGVTSFASIIDAESETLDPTEKTILAKYGTLPVMLFYDFDNQALAGVLTGSEVTFDNIVDMYRLFEKADYDSQSGIYQMTTPSGQKIPFVFDAENGHLVLQDENGEIIPRHSLLDLIYVGANLGLLDRPYLRDWFNKVLRGYKDEAIDFAILALAAAGTGTALISKNKKYKIGGAGVAAVSGAIFGYRVISRQKKQKEAATK